MLITLIWGKNRRWILRHVCTQSSLPHSATYSRVQATPLRHNKSHFIPVGESKRHLTRRRLPPFSSCPWSRFSLRGVTANCSHLRAGSTFGALALSGNVRSTACNTNRLVSLGIHSQGHCGAIYMNWWMWSTGEMNWQEGVRRCEGNKNFVQMPLCSPQIPQWLHSETCERPMP